VRGNEAIAYYDNFSTIYMMDHKCHGKWHLACCALPITAKVFWLLSLVALIMAWVASANADGLACLKARVDGQCPAGGLPVAHLFLDSLALGVLALGLKMGKKDACGECSECESCGVEK
jgi:hypothetical protein